MGTNFIAYINIQEDRQIDASVDDARKKIIKKIKKGG